MADNRDVEFTLLFLLAPFSDRFEKNAEHLGEMERIVGIIETRKKGMFPVVISVVLDILPNFLLLILRRRSIVGDPLKKFAEALVDNLLIIFRAFPENGYDKPNYIETYRSCKPLLCGYHKCYSAA